MKTEVEHRRDLAMANQCRILLMRLGFITTGESAQIYNRLLKYKDKHNIVISEEQLHSVVITYKGDSKTGRTRNENTDA